MSTPCRIQLCRVKGWRKPPGAVVVARLPKWGNPHPVAVYGRDEALSLCREYLAVHPGLAVVARAELTGRDLTCWCELSGPCRACILLEVADGRPS